ncbi:hypothetical protein [Celeribacter sp.]|uniref:hypothetical protein n=1 Tax=Celeribacter sp. TaxID=1890673 RepID=UPI003A937957
MRAHISKFYNRSTWIDRRAEHQNRRLALDRLAALVAAERAETKASHRGETCALHNQLQRGAPRWSFEGRQFKETP